MCERFSLIGPKRVKNDLNHFKFCSEVSLGTLRPGPGEMAGVATIGRPSKGSVREQEFPVPSRSF